MKEDEKKRIADLERELEEAYRSVTLLTNKIEAVNEELKLKNRRLEQANRTIKGQQQELLEKERLKTLLKMAGATAHELNQPLTVIMGYLELMRLEEGNYSCRPGLLEKIYKSAEKIRDIVQRLQKIHKY